MQKLLEYQKKLADLEYTINILSWELRLSTPLESQNNLIALTEKYEKE